MQPQPQVHSSDSQGEDLEQLPITSESEETCITDPQQFLDFSLQDKKIKVMDECNPIWSHVYLKDISLHKKGPLEDKIYSRVGKYYRNIRRGNTLCQIYHHSTATTYDLFFCRRGMKKFYDLEPEYLMVNAVLPTHHRLMRGRIFEGLEKELENAGGKYHLYRLFKENGEHCQVGYLKQLDCWLFASKNVAILARNAKDLQQNYHKERFYWAKLVGEEFFRVLQGWPNERVQQFKKDIDGLTLLGEHCGHDKHQHITKYTQVQIIFYALVNNTGADHCQPVEQCRHFLNKYNLKMSACHERVNLTEKTTILSSMYDMLKEVAEGSMEREGQGSVMYVVCEREGRQRTVAMCKLKTSEYLIYRRLRQMLKLNVSKKGATANHFQKFKFDIEQLLAHYFKPPKPLDFYCQLGEKAFKEIGNNTDISQTYLRYKFVDFIQQIQHAEKQRKEEPEIKQVSQKPKRVLLVCLPRTANTVQKYCKGKQIEWQYMYRSGKPPNKHTVHILYMIPRLPALEPDCQLLIGQYQAKEVEECVQLLSQCKDLSKSHLITFVKSADKGKTVRMLSDKIDAFREACVKQGIPFRSITKPTEEAIISELRKIFEQESQYQQQEKAHEKQLVRKYIVLPMLIPGSGKSSLAQELKKSDREWRIIDTDQIRRDIMQAEADVDLNSAQSQELFIKSKVEAAEQYRNQLISQISVPANKDNFLYVDRLFTPYNIQQTIDMLLATNQPQLRIVILTQAYFPVRLGEFVYPFSWHYLFTCLRRCLQRESHQTMANNPYDVAKIVLKFFQMSANFNEKAVIRANQDRIRFIQLPFVEDSEGSHYIHQNLKKKLDQCLRLIEPGKHAKDSNDFIELIEYIYKYTETKEENSMKKYHQFRLELEKQLTEE